MKGFFSSGEIAFGNPTISSIPQCGLCGLYKKCKSPKMETSGKGEKGVLVVAEAPGKTEDEEGIQLVGKAGKKLREVLSELGHNLERDCWKTNAVICRPPDNKMEDKYIEACRPNLSNTIEELQPETIVLLGGSAIRSVIGMDWKKNVGQAERWTGWRIPSQRWNAWICPTWHPSYLNRQGYKQEGKVLQLLFKEHLEKAFSLVDRPWQKVPEWEKQVETVFSPTTAAMRIRKIIEAGRPVAFDYETNMLKPDSERARIVSCSVCQGEEVVAYPWVGEDVKATGELLRSDIPKYGANIKFEQRWTKKVFGHGVRNWAHDTMQCAHVLDNRERVTSVKFQAYVQLGVRAWDESVLPYLEAKGGNDLNRIDQVPLDTLLLYNGMDAMVEYRLAEKQMGELV